MNKSTILISAILAVFLLAALALLPAAGRVPSALAAAELPARERSITVSGSADVMVVPDEVVLNFSVESLDSSLDYAKSANDAIIQHLLKMTQDMSIDAKQVQTGYISIEPRYQNEYEKRTFLGYTVRKNVTVTLKDLSQFESFLSRALDAGVNHVQGIEFRTSELRKHRDAARALAVKAAREKAAAMAKELGQTIGDPISVREEQSSWYSAYSSWWGGSRPMTQNVVQDSGGEAPASSDSALAPGQIAVSARVAVEFELTK